jgi:hypothetical protein
MQTKKIGYFLSVLLLFSGLIYSVGASTTTVSFRGGGVTIDLAFPEESHPNRTITHDVTITANTNLKLRNFTLFVYAPINSVLQYITNETVAFPSMQENQSLPVVNISIWLPQNVNGRLYCLIYVETEISLTIEHSSCTFYTTLVSDPTFSEIQSEYDALWGYYVLLNASYTALNETFKILSANYTALLSEHNQLITNYNSKVAAYESLLAQYNKLSDDYDTLNANYRSKINELGALQLDYDELNSTRYSLQTSYNTLQAIYDELDQTYNDLLTELNDLQQGITRSESELNINRILMSIFVVVVACLIAFIIYIKRKKPEPYVVIRKETVAMKPEEKS